MRAFLPRQNPTSNRVEAMWYQSWQSGFHDIIKRGFPKPTDERTILAELRSPQVDDFLHHGSGEVPFLVSAHAHDVLESSDLTGFEFGPVVIAKIATKGARKKESRVGEPEDAILKSRGVALDSAPLLFSVRVTGSVDIVPDFESGRTPSGWVSPFRISALSEMPDLWRPRYKGEPFSSWTFCSDRFRSVCENSRLSNIRFETFDSFIEHFREDLKKR
jgi:hypothetical protein